LGTVEVIRREIADLQVGEYLIVDPDSRLTQLGLLPLIPEPAAYVFFESRSYRAGALEKISELTAHWLHQVFGVELPFYPFCAPSATDLALARHVVGAVRARSRDPVVSVNLGVGANAQKRPPDPFEQHLLDQLLRDGATVILDQGGDAEEAARIEALRAACAAAGYGTVALNETGAGLDRLTSIQDARVLTWQGGIGQFAALIGQTDLYIGYDSAGQHIAAALGVATVDIFTGFRWPRMPQRWSPHGPGAVHMVVIDEAGRHSPTRCQTVVEDVLAIVKRTRGKNRRGSVP
jgi:ADP-heptose:LPS heptosyltransferase